MRSKTTLNSLTIVTILFLMGFAVSISAQYRQDAFSANESALVRQIKAIRAAEPNIKPDELAAKANQILAATGIDYYLPIDKATCDKLNAERLKGPAKAVRLVATLQSAGADNAKISLPEPLFSVAGCKGCFVKFAVLEMTATDFVTKVQGANIKFLLPSGLSSTEIWLHHNNNVNEIISRWRVPSRLTPIGVSFDQNVVYSDSTIPK